MAHNELKSKYNRVRTIGNGIFGTIYLVATAHEGTLYAGKEINKRNLRKNGILDQNFDREMKIMRKIRHVSRDIPLRVYPH